MYDNDIVLKNDILNVNNYPCAILDLMMKMKVYVHIIMHHEQKTRLTKNKNKTLLMCGYYKYTL